MLGLWIQSNITESNNKWKSTGLSNYIIGITTEYVLNNKNGERLSNKSNHK